MKFHKPPFSLNEIKIEVTYSCLLNCIHCSSDASISNLLSMSKDECKKIISSAINLGTKEIVFSGGEPLIWEGIEECVKVALDGKLDVSIYTSGYIENFPHKLKLINQHGLPRFIFSIYGSSKTTHDSVTRIDGSFEYTLGAVVHSLDMGNQSEIHFVPFSHTYHELPQIVDLAKKMNIKKISVLRFVPQGRGALMEKYLLNRGHNLRMKKMILDIRKSGFNIRTGSPFNFLLLNDQPECRAAIDRLIISPALKIYPCDAFKQIEAEELVGTLDFSSLDNYSLSECWEKSIYLKAVRQYLTTEFEEPCSSCRVLEDCLSGCLAQKVIAYGSLRKSPDPLCILGKRVRNDDSTI